MQDIHQAWTCICMSFSLRAATLIVGAMKVDFLSEPFLALGGGGSSPSEYSFLSLAGLGSFPDGGS